MPRRLWENYGQHSERGKETVDHVVRMIAGHDLNHMLAGRKDREGLNVCGAGEGARATRTAGGKPALQGLREQACQLLKRSIGLRLVINRTVGHGPAMVCAFVHFTFISASPGFEGVVEPLDGFRRHAFVVGRRVRNKAGR